MPLTMPEGGRSMFAGRSEEEEEVVAVTSGGAETFSEGKRQNLESYGTDSKNNTLNIFVLALLKQTLKNIYSLIYLLLLSCIVS